MKYARILKKWNPKLIDNTVRCILAKFLFFLCRYLLYFIQIYDQCRYLTISNRSNKLPNTYILYYTYTYIRYIL